MAEGYVGFARDHAAYFRIMFRPELSQPEKHPDTEAAGDAAYAILEALTTRITHIFANLIDQRSA
ncbi:TetR-like C-terminal domain-containing protein [Nocardia sp. NPDC059246]|uniref:TetR-like C-terminal domain-containing protein n=1 Tax=unclassified Nocardia TaxID=2637762 RepID=UPI0036B2D11F